MRRNHGRNVVPRVFLNLARGTVFIISFVAPRRKAVSDVRSVSTCA